MKLRGGMMDNQCGTCAYLVPFLQGWNSSPEDIAKRVDEARKGFLLHIDELSDLIRQDVTFWHIPLHCF